jgi:subtilisin family serine protease
MWTLIHAPKTHADHEEDRMNYRLPKLASTLALLLSVSPRASAQAPSLPSVSANTPRAVTLITGDTVTISGARGEAVGIRRAPGREGVRFETKRLALPGVGDRHLFVIPEDAAPLIAAGKVDRRLFDVTQLLEFEYDDAHRSSLPFIITYKNGAGARAAAGSRSVAGAVVGRALDSVNGVSVVAPKARVGDVWNAVISGRAASGSTQAVPSEPIANIWLDGLLRPVLDRSVPQIGAPAAWALGYEGDGVVVGVLDTGVDDTHPDLIDSVLASRNFTVDPDADEVGHGTHVASIIAGSGAASGGQYRGVAPGALLVAAKVCEGFGCPESSIIAGMQWAVAEEGARIVNMSLGGTDTPGYDPMEEALTTLTSLYGALFVVSAGNSGEFEPTVGTPATVAAALAVGAVDRDESLAFFSSRGMTPEGLIKPDLTAPGVDIVAARAAGTELGELVGDDYVMASGTSMAAPHVAGAAALLLQRHPIWVPADLKSALVGSAAYNPAISANAQGGGRVDVAAAIDTSLLASASSLSFGVARWPHEDDAPITRSVTYRNLGAATELALQFDVFDPGGAPAPDGMFRVEPTTLVLPAGGSASVRVTANTQLGSADGVYGGRLVASDATGTALGIPVAVNREIESYDLVLHHTDRQGQPAADFSTLLLGLDSFILEFIGPESGQDRVYRLPKGRYAVEAFIFESQPAPPSLLVAPNLQPAADTVLELDARTATAVQITNPKPGLEPHSATLSYELRTPTSGLSSTIVFDIDTPTYYSGMIEPLDPTMTSALQGLWQDPSVTPLGVYTGGWLGPEGRLPAGDFIVDLDQLAVVHQSYAASLGTQLPNNDVSIAIYQDTGYGSSTLDLALPSERVEHYYSGDPELRWINGFFSYDDDFSQLFFMDGSPAQYRAGSTYRSRWNEPVFCIAMPDVETFFPLTYREGNVLSFGSPLYADSEGHMGALVQDVQSRLYRNGELLGEGGQFELPPEAATYRYELESTQAMFDLTTEQRLVWTFTSSQPPEGELVRLPVLTVRYQTLLDAQGQAPSGPFSLPLRVFRYGNGIATDTTLPRVEVSYDDGLTWAPTAVLPSGEGYEAQLDHPSGVRYVSLRASTEDANGLMVEQTVLRAYAIAGVP